MADGRVEELPAGAAAVEICSADGRLGGVVIAGADGKISVFGPSDDEYKAYARAVKAELADFIKLP